MAQSQNMCQITTEPQLFTFSKLSLKVEGSDLAHKDSTKIIWDCKGGKISDDILIFVPSS